jgi:hypothetical protein
MPKSAVSAVIETNIKICETFLIGRSFFKAAARSEEFQDASRPAFGAREPVVAGRLSMTPVF